MKLYFSLQDHELRHAKLSVSLCTDLLQVLLADCLIK